MGRKNWKESVGQKGPGRKSKKQGNPELPPQLQDGGKVVKRTKIAADLGGRIKQRARKRAVQSVATKVLKQGAKRVKSKDAAADYKSVTPPLGAASLPPTKKLSASSVLKSSLRTSKKKSSTKKQVKMKLFEDGSDGNGGK